MTMINANRGIQGVSNLPNVGSTTETSAFNPADVMPEVASLQFSGDPGAMIAALTMATAKNEREASRTLRNQAMRAQDSAEAAEIQDMRSKADMQRIQGVVDGLCDFAQAGMDVGQGVANLDSTLDKTHADALDRDIKAGDQKGCVPADVRDTNAQVQQTFAERGDHEAAWANGWKAGGEFVGGAKQITDGIFQGALTDKDADAKVHEAAANTYKNMADDFRDDEKDAKELMVKALDFYKDYCDAKSQTALAATHRA